MSGFKEMLAADNKWVFLNTADFAELRTIIYNGRRYEDISVVLSGLKEEARQQKADDHAQGLFMVKTLLQCSLNDLQEQQPQRGERLQINSCEGGSFFREFYVCESVCEFGMLRLELEDLNERNRWNW